MEPIKTIGHLLEGTEERDCIHIAIMAAEELWRGHEVALVYGTKDRVRMADSIYGHKTIGIVDPFFGLSAVMGQDNYAHSIKKGERCWVFLYPGSIQGLRHHWKLPAIDDFKLPENEAEEWLRKFAEKWMFDYDEMIAVASQGSVPKDEDIGISVPFKYDQNWITARGKDLHGAAELGEDYELFWHYLEKLTGQKYDTEHRDKIQWSCTC